MLDYLDKMNKDGDSWFWPTRYDWQDILLLYYNVTAHSKVVKDTKANLKTRAPQQYQAMVNHENLLKSIGADPLDDAAEDSNGTTYWASCENSNVEKTNQAWYYRFGNYKTTASSKTETKYYGRAVKIVSLAAENRKMLEAGTWTKKALREGVNLYETSMTLFGAKQHFQIVTFSPSTTNQAGIYQATSQSTTSTQANAAGALAAINGGYFSATTIGYVRIGGEDKQQGGDNISTTFAGAALTIDGSTVAIKSVKGNTAARELTEPNILVGGPLLLLNGAQQTLSHTSSHNTARNPRTAVGITVNGTVILFIADGRSSSAAGLSNFELASVMSGLQASEAMALDGGGSTTMWTSASGVINTPSDGAERSVANIVYVK